MNIIIYLLFFLVNSEKVIKNIHIPICRNCIHYKPNDFSDFISPLNKCENFGTKDIISGKITYDFADLCRDDESRCGKEGKNFKEEKNINIKIFNHKIIKNIPNISIFVILTVYLFLLHF